MNNAPKFKAGTRVKVTSKFKDTDVFTWVPEMDRRVGDIGIAEYDNQLLDGQHTYIVQFDDGDFWFFTEDSLGFLADPPKEEAEECVNKLVDLCYSASKAAGWWTAKDGTPLQDNPYTFTVKLALIHSELSEALEGDRKDSMDSHLPHRKARAVELADAAIRLFDLAGAYNLDLGGALVEKMAYNLQRKDHKKETRDADGGKKY